jgi:hypothetical protein
MKHQRFTLPFPFVRGGFMGDPVLGTIFSITKGSRCRSLPFMKGSLVGRAVSSCSRWETRRTAVRPLFGAVVPDRGRLIRPHEDRTRARLDYFGAHRIPHRYTPG